MKRRRKSSGDAPWYIYDRTLYFLHQMPTNATYTVSQQDAQTYATVKVTMHLHVIFMS